MLFCLDLVPVLSWSSCSSGLQFYPFSCLVLIPGGPGLTLLAFLAYSSSSSSNFSSSVVCNSAIYRIYRALWACLTFDYLLRHFATKRRCMVGSTSPRGQRRTDFGQVSQWWLSLFIIRLSLCLSLGQWWLSFYQAGIFYGKLSTHHMNLLHLHRRPNHEQQTTISFRGCPAFLRSAKINDFLTKQFPHQPPRAPSLVKCPPFMLFDHSKESSIFPKRKSHVSCNPQWGFLSVLLFCHLFPPPVNFGGDR